MGESRHGVFLFSFQHVPLVEAGIFTYHKRPPDAIGVDLKAPNMINERWGEETKVGMEMVPVEGERRPQID